MGSEQTSCFTRNIGGIDTEITKINYHRKLYSGPANSSKGTDKKNINNNNKNIYYNKSPSSSSRTNTRSDSPTQSSNNNKIIIIQKFIRLYLAKKRFKERLELLVNIIELDNPVNLIKDKITSSK